MEIKNTIKRLLSINDKIEITYKTGTTSTNRAVINVFAGKELISVINGSSNKKFEEEIAKVLEELRSEYPELHSVRKKCEFHFYYPGFNQVEHNNATICITSLPVKSKSGVIKEKYRQTNSSLVRSLMLKYPDYELYLRRGFGFRGSQERLVSSEEVEKAINSMACADVDIIDDEIHINTFSYSDME